MERATIHHHYSGTTTTATRAEAVKVLLRNLRANPTRCEQCQLAMASVVMGSPPWVSCHTCAARHRHATPFERRRMRQARVMGDAR